MKSFFQESTSLLGNLKATRAMEKQNVAESSLGKNGEMEGWSIGLMDWWREGLMELWINEEEELWCKAMIWIHGVTPLKRQSLENGILVESNLTLGKWSCDGSVWESDHYFENGGDYTKNKGRRVKRWWLPISAASNVLVCCSSFRSSFHDFFPFFGDFFSSTSHFWITSLIEKWDLGKTKHKCTNTCYQQCTQVCRESESESESES